MILKNCIFPVYIRPVPFWKAPVDLSQTSPAREQKDAAIICHCSFLAKAGNWRVSCVP